jgi:alpha,alpha-trehalose phosphorylase
MAMVYGFAGFRDYAGRFGFRPRLPERVAGVRFPLTLGGSVLEVDIALEGVTYTLREGKGVVIWHEDEEVRLSPEDPTCERALAPPEAP